MIMELEDILITSVRTWYFRGLELVLSGFTWVVSTCNVCDVAWCAAWYCVVLRGTAWYCVMLRDAA